MYLFTFILQFRSWPNSMRVRFAYSINNCKQQQKKHRLRSSGKSHNLINCMTIWVWGPALNHQCKFSQSSMSDQQIQRARNFSVHTVNWLLCCFGSYIWRKRDLWRVKLIFPVVIKTKMARENCKQIYRSKRPTWWYCRSSIFSWIMYWASWNITPNLNSLW